MVPTLLLAIVTSSTIACAIVGGVFLTFSDFAMRSFAKAEMPSGVEVMQIINREVFRTVFMALLVAMAALSPLLAACARWGATDANAALLVAAGVIYTVGVSGVTLAFNVPMNVRLDRMPHTSAETASYWNNTFYPRWTFWNHVRAIASMASAVLYLIASIGLSAVH